MVDPPQSLLLGREILLNISECSRASNALHRWNVAKNVSYLYGKNFASLALVCSVCAYLDFKEYKTGLYKRDDSFNMGLSSIQIYPTFQFPVWFFFKLTSLTFLFNITDNSY